MRHLRKGVVAWPLILYPKNEAEKRINGHLTDLNDRLAHSLNECDANFAKRERWQNTKAAHDEEGAEFLRRAVKATMSGPTFLSLVAQTDFYCGGAHPYGFTDAAVFDLATGESVDPLKWFEPSANASWWDKEEKETTLERSVSVLGLIAVYKEMTGHGCYETFEENQAFLIWPDAASGKVMIQADHLPGC
jgi:hypothetical protein